MDFDTVRWKLADDLTPDEVDLIVANKDKLNDEEKAAFSGLLDQATPLSDNPLEDAINDAVDETVDAVSKEPVTPTAPIAPVAPAPQQLPDNLVTKDTLDTYIEEKRKEWEAEGKTKAEQEKEEQKIQKYFDEGYKPADWNEYTVAMVEKVTPIIEQRILANLEAKNKKFEDEQSVINKSRQEIFQKFEEEFATLAKNKLIPDPTEDPEGYKKAHEAIIKTGDENGKTNVTDAYKLWSIIPEEHGGGFVTGGVSAQDKEKQRIEQQKQAAGKIGSGRGAPNGNKKGGPPVWANIHNTRMEDLIDARMQQS